MAYSINPYLKTEKITLKTKIGLKIFLFFIKKKTDESFKSILLIECEYIIYEKKELDFLIHPRRIRVKLKSKLSARASALLVLLLVYYIRTVT